MWQPFWTIQQQVYHTINKQFMNPQNIINPYIIPGIVTNYTDIDALYMDMADIFYIHFINKKEFPTLEKFLVAVKSKTRRREIVKFRHIFWYVGFKQLQLSFKKLAEYMNRDNHTTSMNGFYKIEDPISREYYKVELKKFKHLL
jgi:hypothetical protein